MLTGNVSGEGGIIGGLVGTNCHSGTIKECYATGNAIGKLGSIGGLVGMTEDTMAIIENCYANR